MTGYGIEVDEAGEALALGSGWWRALGRIEKHDGMGWRAMGPDGEDVLEVGVNARELAVQALVRKAGLDGDYVIRWSAP